MKKHISLYMLFFAVVLISCNRKKTPNTCTGAICTADFRMITVELKDSLGADFVPDKVETYNSNAQLIHTETSPAFVGNSYVIIDDSDMDDLGVNVNNNVTFKVIKNNTVVHEEPFTVKADCCHVSKVSGAATLIVN